MRLDDDGKSLKCLLCGKKQKLDKSKRSNNGHLNYFRHVHLCVAQVTAEGSKTQRIGEFYGPVETVEKRKKTDTQRQCLKVLIICLIHKKWLT